MSNEKSHKIDAIKYFVPLPEGDYDFQEHLTDYLLTDILNANKQLEKYEARVKELEEKLKRKTQECERSRKRISDLEERIINHSNEVEEYCSRLADKNKKCEKYEQALEEIERYINNQGIDNKWNMRIQRFRSGILDIINKAKGEGNGN